MSANNIIQYTYPKESPASDMYGVSVNGEEVFVYQASVAAFASISFEGRIDVEIKVNKPFRDVLIKPASRGIKAIVAGNCVRFSLTGPLKLSIEIDEFPPLFFYGNPLETDIPSPGDVNVRYFKGGQVYEIGELTLESNEILYMEGGAVLRGNVHALGARNISIRGRGILDGSCYGRNADWKRSILIEECTGVEIEGIIMIEPSTWMIVLCGSRDIHIRNIKKIGRVMGSDGVDVVGSQNILIEDCFMRNNDDCIVIKAVSPIGRKGALRPSWGNDVMDVLVKDCVFINDKCGNALEIGYETQADSISNITFRNCDILSVHGSGAVFSIHLGDRAVVSNVLFEDIRVEHCFDKLIDFRILHSRYNRDAERGQIRNVHLKNIHFTSSIYNPGHTISLISGYDREHTVEGIIIESFYVDDKKAADIDDLYMYVKHASGIQFK